MTEPWPEVDRLFHEVVDLSPEERQAYLDQACGADSSLRAEVESLVVNAQGPTDFLNQPALGPQFTLLPDRSTWEESADAMVGQDIGPYRLEEQIAAGGMGVVYLARRADEEYEKRVAIKLIKRGMDSEQILRRFRQERQTLAHLDHVHIASLLDGGATADGRPYLVMEYIDGVRIDEYCDQRRLSITQRLLLFESVCSAVHYAHQNLVIHRDLKPANILVTRDGEPKLLDFGVAKVLRDERAGAVRTMTAAESRLLTPEYASPEQVLGHAMTTVSDVYSLGVILYELLAGRRPYDLRRCGPGEIERTVCVADHERPSTAGTRTGEPFSQSGEESQRSDPEAISSLRGLTSEGLRRRLRGDLDNIVMMAMRKDPHRRYASVEQFAEDLRRYREGRPVLAQRDTIRYRTAKFLRRNRVGVAAAALVVLSLLVAVVGISWEAQATRTQRDAARANLFWAEGAERLAAEEARRAKAEAETSKQALEFLKQVFRNPDPVTNKAAAVSAREILDRGAARLQDELRDQPAIRATLLDNIGWSYLNLGFPHRAGELLEEALNLRLELFGENHLEVAESLNSLGELARRKGSFDESVDLQRRVLRIHRLLIRKDDQRLARSLSNLALTLVQAGQHTEAEPLLEEALAMARRAGASELRGPWREAKSVLLNNLGGLRFESGRYAEAASLFREAIEIRREHLGDRHPVLANAVHNLGKTLLRLGRRDEALSLLLDSLAMRRELLDDRHPSVAISLYWLATLEYERGQFAIAREYCQEALDIRLDKLPANSPQVAETQSLAGACLLELGRYGEAETLLLKCLGVLEASAHGSLRPVREALTRIIQLYDAWGMPERAEPWRAKLATLD